MGEIIRYGEAKRQGLTRYNTGKPCQHGHASDRYVKGASCVACTMQKAAGYKTSNPQKIKDGGRRYYTENHDRELSRGGRYRKMQREQRFVAEVERINRWAAEHPDAPPLLSRAEAHSRGLKRFFWPSGPCDHGHMAERYVESGRCVACAKVRYGKRDRNAARARYKANYDPERERLNSVKARMTAPWKMCVAKTRERAKKRKLEFELTLEWARSRWTGKCEVTGLPFRLKFGKGGPGQFSPSIDRIDNSRGYLRGNCRFVLAAVNALKSTGTDEEMLAIAIALVSRMSERRVADAA